jgi:hypothetical protein
MKRLMLGVVLASLMGSACAYAPGGVSADGKVVLVKNVGFLFGILNKVFVCKVTDSGLQGCVAGEAP